jgi:hypothetical protein
MSQGPEDQNQPPYGQPADPYGAPRSRSGEQPQYGQAPQFGGQPPYPGQAPYGGQQPYQPVPPQPPKKKGGKILGFGCLGVVAIVIILIVVTVVSGSKSGNTAGGTPAATTAAVKQAAPATSAAAATSAAPATTAAAVPQQVVFSCTGSAPDGVDITYGAEGTNDSASSLPFTKTVPLDSNAQYYNVTAQLSGAGQVSCKTVVDWDGGSPVTQSGSANGGYNIASAEVCSDFSGGWQTC